MDCGEGLFAEVSGGAQLGDRVEHDTFGLAEPGRFVITGVDDDVDLSFGQTRRTRQLHVLAEFVWRAL